MISDDRQSHIGHLIYEKLWGDELLDYSDEAAALRDIKKALNLFVKDHEEVDKKAKSMISSQSKGIVPGSPEWDTLYSKYYEQELKRKGID